MIPNLNKLEIVLDPNSMSEYELNYSRYLLSIYLNSKKKKKDKLDLEIYLDPRKRTKKEIELDNKLISQFIRKNKIISALKELEFDFLPLKEKKELIEELKSFLDKNASGVKIKNSKSKIVKNNYQITLDSKNIAAEPKVNYQKLKKK